MTTYTDKVIAHSILDAMCSSSLTDEWARYRNAVKKTLNLTEDQMHKYFSLTSLSYYLRPEPEAKRMFCGRPLEEFEDTFYVNTESRPETKEEIKVEVFPDALNQVPNEINNIPVISSQELKSELPQEPEEPSIKNPPNSPEAAKGVICENGVCFLEKESPRGEKGEPDIKEIVEPPSRIPIKFYKKRATASEILKEEKLNKFPPSLLRSGGRYVPVKEISKEEPPTEEVSDVEKSPDEKEEKEEEKEIEHKTPVREEIEQKLEKEYPEIKKISSFVRFLRKNNIIVTSSDCSIKGRHLYVTLSPSVSKMRDFGGKFSQKEGSWKFVHNLVNKD